MSLSDRERELLAEMERNFYASEADVVETSAAAQPLNYRLIVLGSLVVLIGVGLLLSGVVAQMMLLGVLGFGVMVAGVLLALKPADSPNGKVDHAASGSKSPGGAGGRSANSPRTGARRGPGRSLSEKLAQRWEDRLRGDR